ncbi:hypothetical protein, partial [Mannheimia haemolytica]|uniref:hypothetical protein n=1 Tax=Mannheimia haemolytica TaxID=75985 RepID=UPI001EE19C8B
GEPDFYLFLTFHNGVRSSILTAESGRGSRGQSPFARSKRKLEEYPFCVLAIKKDNSTPKAPRVIYKNQRSR